MIAAQTESAPLTVGTSAATTRFSAIEQRIDAIANAVSEAVPMVAAAELLRLGEEVLELWVEARGETPVRDEKEGFRLLALHRQGARGQPSFNACRETARELVYHFNLIAAEENPDEARRHLRLMTMVTKHLCLFVEGKCQVEGLGGFCCAAKPLRAGGN